MPWFKCFIEGENFPGTLIEKDSPIGFYTTRFVEADNSDVAELLVLENLKHGHSLALPEGSETPANAKVFVETVTEVSENEVQENPGFAFF